MGSDAIKDAEKRGYSKGYAAGIRRVEQIELREEVVRRQNSHWNRAFLALLPPAMMVQGWKFGEEPITSGDDHIKLAVAWANRAAKQMRPET